MAVGAQLRFAVDPLMRRGERVAGWAVVPRGSGLRTLRLRVGRQCRERAWFLVQWEEGRTGEWRSGTRRGVQTGWQERGCGGVGGGESKLEAR